MDTANLHGLPVAFLKWEAIEIPLGKRDQVHIDGRPHIPIGSAFTPGAVRRVDEPAQRQEFLPVIGFHSRKYRPEDRAPAIRCFPHAGLDEAGAQTLSHDDFRRAHDEFRGVHYNYRRSHDHGVMMFVSCMFVPAPIAFRENAAAGGEEGDDAG